MKMSYGIAIIRRERAGILRVGSMLGLFAYGLIVDPDTGKNGIPCLWKSFFNVTCPGCGLSRAGALLLRCRFSEAVATNVLIVPSAIVFVREFVVQIVSWLGSCEQIRLLRRNAKWQN